VPTYLRYLTSGPRAYSYTNGHWVGLDVPGSLEKCIQYEYLQYSKLLVLPLTFASPQLSSRLDRKAAMHPPRNLTLTRESFTRIPRGIRRAFWSMKQL